MHEAKAVYMVSCIPGHVLQCTCQGIYLVCFHGYGRGRAGCRLLTASYRASPAAGVVATVRHGVVPYGGGIRGGWDRVCSCCKSAATVCF